MWDGVFEGQCSSRAAVQRESLSLCINVWSVFSCDTASFSFCYRAVARKAGRFFYAGILRSEAFCICRGERGRI